MLISKLCSQDDFETAWFGEACQMLHEDFKYHRKLWEWCYIYQALLERGLLVPGRRGLGFGVGREPLASLFASHGCGITASDLATGKASRLGWVQTNQHSTDLEDLNRRGICDQEQFSRLVTFEYLDMNSIGSKYDGGYDFTWSSCAFEHLGSIRAGINFILNQMNCLRPGGIAVHTTEFNLSSNSRTLDWDPGLVIFRRRDIEEIARALRNAGCSIEVDYTAGEREIESIVDLPPYSEDDHIRLQLDGYTCTSIGLIIEKGERTGRLKYRLSPFSSVENFRRAGENVVHSSVAKLKNAIKAIPGARALVRKVRSTVSGEHGNDR